MSCSQTDSLLRILSTHRHDIDAILRSYASDEMDRDDLRQEIAIALWKAMPKFRGLSSERTYVLRIAHNRALDFRMRHARNQALFRPLDMEPAPLERDSAEYEIEQLSARLHEAMAQLPRSQYEMLSLVAAGVSATQIAMRTGRTAGAVRVALHRARSALRQLVLGKGADARDA